MTDDSQLDTAAVARRRFLGQAVSFSLGSVMLTLLPWASAEDDAAAGKGVEGSSSAPPRPPRYGFLVDTDKCTGAGKCLSACRVENDVPEGYVRTWVERYVQYKDGRVTVDAVPEGGYAESGLPIIDPAEVARAYFVPKLCNHCKDAPCNQVCPVHASFTSPEGFELVDADRCIGCAYCVQACPYGTRFINPDTGTADKCTWCYHRVTRDQQPACVEACPTGARLFGRVDDPNSEISRRLAQLPSNVLKSHLGTHPQTRYTRLPDEVT